MSEGSPIEWTDHTFNPWWGCVEVSPGCAHCYARIFAKRTGHHVWGKHAPRRTFGAAHWAEPLKWNEAARKAGKRSRVFCASMADLFEDFGDHPQAKELEDARTGLFVMTRLTPWLDWLLLTKRPENINRFAPAYWGEQWPENVWAGTTVEDQRRTEERLPHLRRVPARVRFLSIEPLLEELGELDLSGIGWAIVGGESGPGARPMEPAWARSIRDQCVAAGVPFFFKQWGGIVKKVHGRRLDGRTWDEMPAGPRLHTGR